MAAGVIVLLFSAAAGPLSCFSSPPSALSLAARPLKKANMFFFYGSLGALWMPLQGFFPSDRSRSRASAGPADEGQFPTLRLARNGPMGNNSMVRVVFCFLPSQCRISTAENIYASTTPRVRRPDQWDRETEISSRRPKFRVSGSTCPICSHLDLVALCLVQQTSDFHHAFHHSSIHLLRLFFLDRTR